MNKAVAAYYIVGGIVGSIVCVDSSYQQIVTFRNRHGPKAFIPPADRVMMAMWAGIEGAVGGLFWPAVSLSYMVEIFNN